MSAEFKWYVAHTYSGYENKVKDSIEKTVENRGLGDLIGEVCIPVEEAVEELAEEPAAEEVVAEEAPAEEPAAEEAAPTVEEVVIEEGTPVAEETDFEA